MSSNEEPTSVQHPMPPATTFVRRGAVLAVVLTFIFIFCRVTGFPPDSQASPADFSFDDWAASSPMGNSLSSVRNADREKVSSDLEGKWVAQLASQAQGENDQAYLLRHQDLDSSYGTYLISTNDYSYPNTDDVTYWVTLLSTPFDSEAEAAQWCTNQGLTSNDCLADFLAR